MTLEQMLRDHRERVFPPWRTARFSDKVIAPFGEGDRWLLDAKGRKIGVLFGWGFPTIDWEINHALITASPDIALRFLKR